ncbi:MAG: methylmalonyl-CoA mutase [Gemmatimonadetes bacterium]|uniref:Methylmalonyl-CoA mutase n=1 Tax=Candidatus Kutchimonas denitrificans TaxID=3056748 RepID=A0AAE4ZCZ0_9BACT|nr:methylmalonyl-CoA mutase [Gemmatimonadota bacterium]NIR75685.1 methylmalonyl-CoA mutase [Candidatus Kutchimonas denitrificans]NIS00298.1 methylmalonyl-CoA mutase [Gemmatimonadota bacterium]NIT65957.1 methylmalonyl-CoA mutase [Gemmatimonadota bacterium]NIU53661.1 methylmalonyl-CoA mutase [Gemmatimonadota bacterium]
MTERKRANTSGIEIKPVYDADDPGTADAPRPEPPGSFPFTRGIYESMYRGRLWTMRQYAGFGTAEDTNRRFRFLLESGQTGLSVAFDLPTQMGYDSDHAMAQGEVGRVGVAIDTVDDLGRLFDGIDLGQVSTSMTINATASILLAMYVCLADERGVQRGDLAGTVQNDILKEFIARGTYVFPVEPSLRLVTDVFDFCASELPRWNSISISGYHMREAGCTAAQEIAFTLANGLEYVQRAVDRGLEVERFAPRLSFFFASHNDLFEEVAKFRAARRLWARLMRDRYGASDRACQLRFHTQTGGSTLTAQQPQNNVVRVTVQALAAVLGGTQSLHTNAFDEALALPTADSARLALRTQQILAHESGVAATADPLAGSYYIETITAQIENKARTYLNEIADRGGAAASLDFMVDEIQRSAYAYQLAIENEERVVVGVNRYREDESESRIEQPSFPELEARQRQGLDAERRRRDAGAVQGALKRLAEAASGPDNLMPYIVDAVKARATLGEISDALREVWGEYRAAS